MKSFDHFQNRNVLVTGHTGFKGSWLCLWLQALGAQVTGIALPPSSDRPSMFELANVGDEMESTFVDIRDLERTTQLIHKCEPEILFHLAAQPIVRESYARPIDTFMTNVMGTAHVLNAVRDLESIKAVVIVTSDKCYENAEWVWGYRESDPLGGSDPYSASKGAAEIVTSSFRRSYPSLEGKIASVRAGNVIGGGDWASDRLIPDIVRAIARNKKVLLRNPRAHRPWQHVLEPLHGYLMLAAHLMEEGKRFAEAWNFGPQDSDRSHSVSTIAALFAEAWGISASDVLDFQGAADFEGRHEAGILTLDSSKAAHFLGWKPTFTTKQAVELTADWYKTFVDDKSALKLKTLAQIQTIGRGQEAA